MNQYKNMFKKYRRPDKQRDVQLYRNSQHCMIMSNGCFFTLNFDSDLESQLHWILNNRPETLDTSPLFTTDNRRQWARHYHDLKRISESNRSLLADIESAAFIVCIDRTEEKNGGAKIEQFLHGGKLNRTNRWYDATIQLIIDESGQFGICYEHSVCEGVPVINFAHYIKKGLKATKEKYYFGMKPVQRRCFQLNSELESALTRIDDDFTSLQERLDLKMLRYTKFGKGFIKSQNMSPDAFIQVSLQLAYYEVYSTLCSTYESASIRRFKKVGNKTFKNKYVKRVVSIISAPQQATSYSSASMFTMTHAS